MNCYFCNQTATKSLDRYICNTCNADSYYFIRNLQLARLYHKSYFINLNFAHKSYALYKFYKLDPLYKWDYIPNITPQNIESKINTILAFL